MKDDGYITITLLAEGSVQAWVDDYSITHPVLEDTGWAVSNRYERDNGIPTFSVIGRDMTLRTVDAYSENVNYEAVIQEALAEEPPVVEWDEPPELTDGDGGGEGGAGDLALAEVDSPFGGAGGTAELDSADSPYGGASCSAVGGSSGGWLAVLLGRLAVLRRRTS